MPRSSHQLRISSSSAGWSGTPGSGLNMRKVSVVPGPPGPTLPLSPACVCRSKQLHRRQDAKRPPNAKHLMSEEVDRRKCRPRSTSYEASRTEKWCQELQLRLTVECRV